MPEKFKQLAMKPKEYKKLVALAKRKGFKYIAPYIYILVQKEISRQKLTPDDIERLNKYGSEYGKDYW